MKIAVIDGQGGRIGATLIEALRKAGITAPHIIWGIGTNAMATSAMLRAGADQGATGSNPVVVTSSRADLIVGPMGIVMTDALLGEITAEMAAAVCRSSAQKILLPFNHCGITVVGTQSLAFSQIIESATGVICDLCRKEEAKSE